MHSLDFNLPFAPQGKPLVSGSALRGEGQLTVYNYKGGPCYRCIFPNPPPHSSVSACSDSGVVGMITGTIGVLQALEVVKIVTETGTTFAQRLLVVDGMNGLFRCVRLRPRQKGCAVCGEQAAITTLLDYEVFCGMPAGERGLPSLHLLPSSRRITAQALAYLLQSPADSSFSSGNPLPPSFPTQNRGSAKVQHMSATATDTSHIIPYSTTIAVTTSNISSARPRSRRVAVVDVRPPVQFGICALPGSINIPIDHLMREGGVEEVVGALERDGVCVEGKKTAEGEDEEDGLGRAPSLVFVCRRGNDSQLAVEHLALHRPEWRESIVDLEGGLVGWAQANPEFPIY